MKTILLILGALVVLSKLQGQGFSVSVGVGMHPPMGGEIPYGGAAGIVTPFPDSIYPNAGGGGGGSGGSGASGTGGKTGSDVFQSGGFFSHQQNKGAF